MVNEYLVRSEQGRNPVFPIVQGALMYGPRQAFVFGTWEHEYIEAYAFGVIARWKKHGDCRPTLGYVKVGTHRRCTLDMAMSGPARDVLAAKKIRDHEGYMAHKCLRLHLDMPEDVQDRLVDPLKLHMDDTMSREKDGVVVVPRVLDVSFLAKPKTLFIVIHAMHSPYDVEYVDVGELYAPHNPHEATSPDSSSGGMGSSANLFGSLKQGVCATRHEMLDMPAPDAVAQEKEENWYVLQHGVPYALYDSGGNPIRSPATTLVRVRRGPPTAATLLREMYREQARHRNV